MTGRPLVVRTIAVLLAGTVVVGAAFLPAAAEEKRPTRTTLSVSPGASSEGQAVTLTATVEAPPPSEPPVGGVEFFDGPVRIGSATLPVEGDARTATLELTGLSVGPHHLTARYIGHPAFAPSVSAPVNHVVAAQ